MKKQKLEDLIKEFTLKQSGLFELEELMRYVKHAQKGFDDDERLYRMACESPWLFEDGSDLVRELFMPRHCFFKGAEFLIKPLPEEVEGGYLVPGHRMVPFLSRAKLPFEATLKLPDGSVVTTRKESFVAEDVMKYLMFFGDYGMISYLVDDDLGNGEKFYPPYAESVTLTVFEMRKFFAESNFKAGDSLLLRVEDWLEGIYALQRVPSKGRAVDFEATHDWCQRLRRSFDEVRWYDDNFSYDCHEQAALTFWLAEQEEGNHSVITNPPLSFSAFFNLQKDLIIKTYGQLSFFWSEDESIEDRLMDAMLEDGPEPETALEGLFQVHGISVDQDDAEAYMRDALAHGGKDPEAVLERVISGRTLYFPTKADKTEFRQLWRELWDEVRESYDPAIDCMREIRSIFLKLNDQCLQALREMDHLGVDAYDLLKSPDSMKLGEINAIIHQTLTMCNRMNEMPESIELFSAQMAELSQNISAIIEDLASRLCKRPAKSAPPTVAGLAMQLKISLNNSKPLIWRRVLVRYDIELEELHDVIQAVFGWASCHLHQFIDKKSRYQPGGSDDPAFFMVRGINVQDSKGVFLRDLLSKVKDKITYEYDFGDSWMHQIVLEKILLCEPTQSLPFCVTGKQACPPEDCGGIYGYYALLETLSGPDCGEKEEMLEWCDGPIDPKEFDLDAANERLER